MPARERIRRLLPALLVVAVSVLLLFFLRNGTDGTDPTEPPAPPTTAADSAGQPAQGEADTQQRSPSPAAPAVPTPPSPPEAPFDSLSEPAEEPAGTPPIPALASLDVLVLADGMPVANAEVSVAGPQLPAATTDAQGRCRFLDLPPGEAAVSARSDAGRSTTRTLLLPGANRLTLALLLPRSLEVEVVVAEPGEPPVPGAAVILHMPDGPRPATTDAEGLATMEELPSGRFSLDVLADGFAAWYGSVNVLPTDRAERNRKQVSLKPGNRVCGRVVDADWKPVEGATVWSVAHDIGIGSGWARCGPQGRSAPSNSEGRFCLAALVPGTYELHGTHPTRGRGESASFTLGREPADGIEVALRPAASASGKVVDEEGKPVVGALVAARYAADVLIGPACVDTLFATAVSGADGTFDLKGLGRTKVRVRALSGEAMSEPVDVDLRDGGDATGIILVLADAAVIAGTVETLAGTAAPGVAVLARPERVEGMPFALESTTTGADGGFRLGGLTPGTWYLQAGTAAVDPTAWLHFGKGTRAQTGDEEVRLVLVDTGGIRGKVTRADGTTPVRQFGIQVAGFPPRWFDAEDGRFELSPFNAGTFRVQVRADCCEDRDLGDIVLEEGEVTDLGTVTLGDGRTVNGVVLDGQGKPLAGALVRCGTDLPRSGSGELLPGSGTKRVSRADGTFAFAGLETSVLQAQATHENGCVSETVVIPAGTEDASVELPCRTGATLSGEVFVDDRPAAGRMVALSKKGVVGSPTITRSSENGAYRFENLGEADYELQVIDFGASGGHVVRRSIELAPGADHTEDLTLRTGPLALTLSLPEAFVCDDRGTSFVLAGNASLPLPEGGIKALLEAVNEYWFTMAKEGPVASFSGLPPGNYVATATCISDMRAMNSGDSLPPDRSLTSAILLQPSGPTHVVVGE